MSSFKTQKEMVMREKEGLKGGQGVCELVGSYSIRIFS